ncbi:hypothetical protein EH223_15925 [candidate division KSB1 bacterium]|nr:hypothetical protein [candidate division KSB1 bacterium]RQW01184.1 MAG: hypothetical protein EH223_15925 [candidate division KSB1 bacterium]
MIVCIFTIDYELYGNGDGNLYQQVYEPAERLQQIFLSRNARFVTFVEVAELEIIEAHGTDSAIDKVKKQLRDLYKNGFEIGLHVHPQWYNARYDQGHWQLDEFEYNLCALPKDRIEHIINRAINYLRKVLNQPDYIPLCFRNSNWLFQPSQDLAGLLVDQGIKVDSSVYKGGFQHKHHLDYRRALKNGYFWKFARDVNIPDPSAQLLEIPTYSRMVYTWQLLSQKRMRIQQQASAGYPLKAKLDRLTDFLHVRQPLKLDFCRLTIKELVHMFDRVLKDEKKAPESFKPIVAIGHTKDLQDYATIEAFLAYLQKHEIALSTFGHIYDRCGLS